MAVTNTRKEVTKRDVVGLTTGEAHALLAKHGPNTLPERPPPSDVAIFASQLKNPLVYVLLGAALITFLLRDFADTTIILIAVFINAILGFWQERRANRALVALKKLLVFHAEIIRDGQRKSIISSEIVPGDVVILPPGGSVPADGVMLESKSLFINEAILTGEAVPVAKKRNEAALFGTVVIAGHGKMLVTKTGALTQMGKIASQLGPEEQVTPFKYQLIVLSRHLALLVGALAAVVFGVGSITGRPVVEMFVTSVALAVSAIPEGLLISATAVLAIGMQRILRKKGLVRRLLAAETLGGVTTLCIDKTGTLTEGTLTVKEALFTDQEMGRKAVILINDRYDPLEIAAWEWVRTKGDAQDILKRHPRVDEMPFSSAERFAATLHREADGGGKTRTLVVSGAPELVLGWSRLPQSEKTWWKNKIDELATKGMRLTGFAYKKVRRDKKRIRPVDVKSELVWLGLMAFADPVRPDAKRVLEKARKAGIKIKVITGDYKATALSVMESLGMEVDQGHSELVLEGKEVADMTERELASRVEGVVLFARTTPEQKLAIVNALLANGEVVAMMGDGVNDAPALQKADIGIVVGEASDVARESADLILLDSSFDTILEAIEEGRGIFDNLRKMIVYLLSDAFGEIVAIIGGIFLALPLPVVASQILWINLVSDGFPNLALAVDPKREKLMSALPRPRSERLVNSEVRSLIVITSIASGVLALAIFVFFLKTTGDLTLARSVAFLTLGINSLLYVLSVRTLHQPVWKDGIFTNGWLLVAVVAGFVLQAMPFYVPWFTSLLGVVPLGVYHWAVALAAGIFVVGIIETVKFSYRRSR